MSPKVSPHASVTTTVTTELKLQPALKRKALQTLRVYEELSQQRATLNKAVEKQQATLSELFDKAGASQALLDGVSLDGFKLKTVNSLRTDRARFDKHLVSLGVSVEMLEEARVRAQRPCQPYLKITTPSSAPEGAEE